MSDPESEVVGEAGASPAASDDASSSAQVAEQDTATSEPTITPGDYVPVVTRLPEALAEEQAERDAAALDTRIAQLIEEGQEPAEAERIARGLPEVAAEPDDA